LRSLTAILLVEVGREDEAVAMVEADLVGSDALLFHGRTYRKISASQ